MDTAIFRAALEPVESAMRNTIANFEDHRELVRALNQLKNGSQLDVLRSLIANDSYFDEFRNKHRAHGDSGRVLNIEALLDWIVVRAATVGSTQVVAELSRYHDNNSYQCTFVVALANVHAQTVVPLGDGVRIAPYSRREFLHEDTPSRSATTYNALDQIASALMIDVDFPKLYGMPTDPALAPGELVAETAWGTLDAARMCMALVVPIAPGVVGRTIVVDESVPLGGGGAATYHSHVAQTSSMQLSPTFAQEIQSIYAGYARLTAKAKDNLRVPLQRFENAKQELMSMSRVDAAIDLGIALEALLLAGDEQTEISYRFALRGAHLLGSDAQSRRRLFNEFSGCITFAPKRCIVARCPRS